MFTTTSDPRNGLVQATLQGFFDVQEVELYAAEVEPLIRKAVARLGGYSMLLDVSACVIQAQEVVAAFQRHVAAVPRARRCAIVTGDSAIRLQVRRIMQGPSMRGFASRAPALEWLLDAADAPRPDTQRARAGV